MTIGQWVFIGGIILFASVWFTVGFLFGRGFRKLNRNNHVNNHLRNMKAVTGSLVPSDPQPQVNVIRNAVDWHLDDRWDSMTR